MLAPIRAEIRKIFTVRSTYFVMLFLLLLIGLFAFWGNGLAIMKNIVLAPDYLMTQTLQGVNVLGVFIALIGALQVTHEYRYNTIMYTLTANKSRSRVLLSKIVVFSLLAIVLALVVGVLAPLATAFGLALKGVPLPPQTFYFKDLIWHVALYGWGFAMVGLLFAILIRNQVGALVTLLLYPIIVEPLLAILLQGAGKYLPFQALASALFFKNSLKPATGAMVFLLYLVIGWIITWILFLRRDAN